MKIPILRKSENLISILMLTIMLVSTTAFAADDSAALKDEIANLKNKVAELEQKLNQQNLPPSTNQQNVANSFNQPRVYSIKSWGNQDAWDPFAEMEQMQQQMNQMFNNSFWRGQGSNNIFSLNSHFDPTTDIQETKEGYVVKLDIPGMEKGDINLEVKDNHLIVSGEKKSDKEENNQNKFYRRERSFGYFSRVVPLPDDANPEKVDAEYSNGILTVKVGKRESKNDKQVVKKVQVK